MSNLGEWGCGRLAGRNAVHAGDPILSGDQRAFGLILQHFFEDVPLSREPLAGELARCDETLAEVVEYVGSDSATGSISPADASNAILQFKAAGVTSIYCLCGFVDLGILQRAATSQAYFPEWLVSTYFFLDDNAAMQTLAVNTREQMSGVFGLSFAPMQVPAEQAPHRWAIREMDPSYRFNDSGLNHAFAQIWYRELLALSSGIQMAGPDLTPEAFASGLQRTTFPNPEHPNMPGRVGFEDGHTMLKDAAEIWWSNTARSPYDNNPGAYCYVDGGVRHQKGQWPEGGDPFFEQPCFTGAR